MLWRTSRPGVTASFTIRSVAGQVGVHHVLAAHGLLQLDAIEDIAVDDPHARWVGVPQSVRAPQVQRQMQSLRIRKKGVV
jgi:hypothetical protein